MNNHLQCGFYRSVDRARLRPVVKIILAFCLISPALGIVGSTVGERIYSRTHEIVRDDITRVSPYADSIVVGRTSTISDMLVYGRIIVQGTCGKMIIDADKPGGITWSAATGCLDK